jgi:tungstate transport system ATP-binding protein
MGNVLQLESVTVQLGRGGMTLRPLEGVNVSISAGERVALIGANGSGKSTLLRVLAGVQPIFSGRRYARNVPYGMVFQHPYLLRMSVLRNIALAPWLAGMRWSEARDRAMATLQTFGLTDLAGRSAHMLSGGQLQRVAIARAWAGGPQILFLDEPSANLDPRSKREAEAFVQQVTTHDPALTLVFASHNLGQVKRLATRVIYMEAGTVCADLPVGAFFEGHRLVDEFPAAHKFVRGDSKMT